MIRASGVEVSNLKILGTLLRNKRKEQHLTQGQISSYCGVSVRFISEVERGKETAEIGKVLLLLRTLGIDLIADSRD